MRSLLMLSVMVALALAARTGAADATLALAAELFAEGRWQACRIECLRTLANTPDDKEAALLKARAEARLGLDCRESLRRLADDPGAPEQFALCARYELGCAEWRAGNASVAFQLMRNVFEKTTAADLFVQSGRALEMMLEQDRRLARTAPELPPQLATASELWAKQPVSAWDWGQIPGTNTLSGLPARWLIAFYRSQISPALGDRCSLAPSCSEYALQSLRRHGTVLGLAMIADRFYREPSVVSARRNILCLDTKEFYEDPVADHDFWLPGAGR